jgi:hypothetical protein
VCHCRVKLGVDQLHARSKATFKKNMQRRADQFSRGVLEVVYRIMVSFSCGILISLYHSLVG